MSNATLCLYKGPAAGFKNILGHWLVCALDTINQSIKRRRIVLAIYSHVELQIDGVCYSSSFRDHTPLTPNGGVRSKVITDFSRFDLYPCTVDKEAALARFKADEGKHYSWVAMLRVCPLLRWLPRRDATQRFCSDEVAFMLGVQDPETLSPQDVLERFALQ